MKAIFCHNNVFLTGPEGTVRSEPQFGTEAWSRYLQVFDSLTVVARMRRFHPDEDPARFDVSERDRVDFRFLPNLSGPIRMFANRRTATAEMESVISDSDAVIVRGAGEIPQLGARVARRMGKPLAVEVVGCAWDQLWHYGTWQGKVFAPFSYLRMRRTVARAPFAIYVTEKFLQRRYPCHGRTAVASNVQIEETDPAVLWRRLERIEAAPRPPVIGLIGSLVHRHKGLHVALAALARARPHISPFEFRVLGNGDPTRWRKMADQLGIGDFTRFCGTVPSGEPVLEWLDDLDLYLQPSLTEGLPRAVIEAMSRGCPTLGSSAGGTVELLEPDALHSPGDVQRLSDQIVTYFGDRDRQSRAARRNFEVARRYSASILSSRRHAFWRMFANYSAAVQNGGPFPTDLEDRRFSQHSGGN